MVSELSVKEKDEKVLRLAKETKMATEMAKEFLELNDWNVDAAIRGYKSLVERDLRNGSKMGVSPSPERRACRGMSVSNMPLVEEARKRMVDEEHHFSRAGGSDLFECSAKTSFILPDINELGAELANIMRKDLIDANAFANLQKAERLNWWADIGACRKLFPLSTNGDGNCLLHAASLGMLGFHDRLLVLRKALYEMLRSNRAKGSLKRRWKYELWKENLACGGLTYTREEWEDEWDEVVKSASDRRYTIEDGKPKRKISRNSFYGMPRAGLQRSLSSAPQRELLVDEYLQSLEPIHVYALANLLCRPIVIIADKMLKDVDGNALAPIPFGGIYLPLECQSETCCRYPLVLSYDASHFSPLVPAQGEHFATVNGVVLKLSSSVPVMEKDFTLMPVKYTTDPGNVWDLVQDDSVREELPELSANERVELLAKYMDLFTISTLDRRNIASRDPAQEVVESALVLPLKALSRFALSPSEVAKIHPTEVLAAKLNVTHVPTHYKEMIASYTESCRRKIIDSTSAQEKSSTKEKKTVSQSPRFSNFPEHVTSPLSLIIRDAPTSPPSMPTRESSKSPASPKVKEASTPPPSPGSKSVAKSPSSPIFPFINNILKSPSLQRKSKAQKSTSSPTMSNVRRVSSKPCAVPTCPNNTVDDASKYCSFCARRPSDVDQLEASLGRQLLLPLSPAESDNLLRQSSRQGSSSVALHPTGNLHPPAGIERVGPRPPAGSEHVGRGDERSWSHRRSPSTPVEGFASDGTTTSFGLAIGLVKKPADAVVDRANQPRPVQVAIDKAPAPATMAPLTVSSKAVTPNPGRFDDAKAKSGSPIPFVDGKLCISDGCTFHGSAKTSGYCSYCYKQMRLKS